jgi:hypothetical protein
LRYLHTCIQCSLTKFTPFYDKNSKCTKHQENVPIHTHVLTFFIQMSALCFLCICTVNMGDHSKVSCLLLLLIRFHAFVFNVWSFWIGIWCETGTPFQHCFPKTGEMHITLNQPCYMQQFSGISPTHHLVQPPFTPSSNTGWFLIKTRLTLILSVCPISPQTLLDSEASSLCYTPPSLAGAELLLPLTLDSFLADLPACCPPLSHMSPSSS